MTDNLLDLEDNAASRQRSSSLRRLKVPISLNTTIEDDSALPLDVAKHIAFYLPSLSDILAFSLVNKNCHRAVYENDSLWVKHLQIINVWDRFDYKSKSQQNTYTQSQLQEFESSLNPINCLDKNRILYEKKFAAAQFKSIYQQISPVFKDLIIVNSSNFGSSKFLKQYTDPETQVIIFNNLANFLQLYKEADQYNSYSVRLNALIDLFVNSVFKEIETNFGSGNHAECARFIKIASQLNKNTVSNVVASDMVVDFFMNSYVDDFNFLNTNEAVSSCFYMKTNRTHIDYEQLSNLFEQVRQLLGKEFNEIKSIFQHGASSTDLNEIPVILRMVENFLQNVLIHKFVESLITMASLIDEREEHVKEIIEVEPAPIPFPNENSELEPEIEEASEATEWSEIAASNGRNEEIKEEKQENLEKESGIKEMREAPLYFQLVPYVYRKLVDVFSTIDYPRSFVEEDERKAEGQQDLLLHTEEQEMDYKKISVELVEFHYEQFLTDFIDKLPLQCKYLLEKVVNDWKLNLQQQESSQASQILDAVISDDTKNKNFLKLDIFTGFSKIFKVGNSVNVNEVTNTGHTALTKNEANLKILSANLSNIKSLISLDLAITLLRTLKENTELLLSLTGRKAPEKQHKKKKIGEYLPTEGYTNEDLKHRVNFTCQEMFNDMANILMDSHIKSGFDKALERLKNYRPSDLKNNSDNTVDPIINFIELVNVGDLIQQMISVFYREELVNTKIVVQKHKTKKDFLMANKCEKSIRKFENMLDNYVADGLNISIDVLMSEISYGIMTALQSSDFNISEKDLLDKKIDLGSPSRLGRKLLKILENHVNLLTGSIDKTIVDVFQQEIGERFVSMLVKLITKDLIISTTGAIILISDLNSYYNFFLKIKTKPVLAYLTALKTISQIYLIETENSKDIGKLVVKIGRENGIFNQEEIYEFVTRRADWDIIKKDVDKIMYGLGIADCVIS